MADTPSPEARRSSGANLFRRVFDIVDAPNEVQAPSPQAPPTEPSMRPVVRLCNLILAEGLLNKSTKIRLAEYEPEAGSVEYFIGDEWKTVMKVPVMAHRPLINRLKVMAALDISRVPEQRGEVHVNYEGSVRKLGITVQALPTGSDVATLEIPAAS